MNNPAQRYVLVFKTATGEAFPFECDEAAQVLTDTMSEEAREQFERCAALTMWHSITIHRAQVINGHNMLVEPYGREAPEWGPRS